MASLSRPITIDLHRCPCNPRSPVWHLMVANLDSDGEGSGVRALGGKCCGIYHERNVAKSWRLTIAEARRLIEDIENCIEAAERGEAQG